MGQRVRARIQDEETEDIQFGERCETRLLHVTIPI